jgi:hypothetical protein
MPVVPSKVTQILTSFNQQKKSVACHMHDLMGNDTRLTIPSANSSRCDILLNSHINSLIIHERTDETTISYGLYQAI